jgi:outer membrane receptor protein involved in Fe transport
VPIIRGIASETEFGFTAQTTGLYLDDMPFADLTGPQSMPDLNPFDMERIEVLKGPQSTLFGSGALAGAVRYIAHKPVHNLWQAKAYHVSSRTRGGGGEEKTTAGAINVPLFGDAVALRAVGMTRDDPGLYDMSATDPNGNTLRDEPNADKRRQAAWRGLASWQASDDLKLSAFYFGQYTDSDDVSFPLDYAPFASPSAYRFGGGNLLATYDLGWASLLSSTNRMTKHTYNLAHQEFLLDQHQQNDEEFYNQLIGDVRGWTQELRLISPEGGDGNWEWLLGAAVMRYDQFIFQYGPMPGPPMEKPRKPSDVSQSEKVSSFIYATIANDATEQAVFGEATRRLGEHWELTLGLRGYRTELIADTVVSGVQIVALTQQEESRQHFEPRSSGVNPKASIRYVHNDHVQAYALAAKGFQFGGVQLNPPVDAFVTSAEQSGFRFAPYDSSKLWNYEVGIRTDWLDRRLRFDVGLFYLDWSDLQLTIAVPLANTDATFGLIANVGRAHSTGVETSLQVIPFHGARVTSSAAWIEAVTDVPFDESNSAGPVPPGTRLPGTPGFMWANVFSYEHTLPFFGNWAINPVLTHSYIGESPDAIRPTDTIGGYDTLDARLAIVKSDSRYQPEVSFGINNLTDTRGVTYHEQNMAATGSGNIFHFTHYVQPRTAMLSLSFKY